MLYINSFKKYILSLLVLVPFRCFLKILTVDLYTGFYEGGQVWVSLFNVLLAAAIFGIIWAVWRTDDRGMDALKGNRWLESTSALFGIILAGTSFFALLDTMKINPNLPVVNALPKWLLTIEHLLGVISGCVMILLAFVLIAGAKRSSIHGAFALIPIVWQMLSAIQRYISFRQVFYNSDQLIETLFMVSSLLFLLYHARCLSGLLPNRKRVLIFAMLTSLLGFVLMFGQLAARYVLGSVVSGPDPVRILFIGAISLYAAVFAFCVAKAPQMASA